MNRSLTHCHCGLKFGVIDSRIQTIDGYQTVWRRKVCRACGTRFNTIELDEAIAREVLSDD